MKKMNLLEGETPASAVRLARSVLVETDQGEMDAAAGDWLVVTSMGRQIILSDNDYQASMIPNASEPEDDSETVERDTTQEKPVPGKKYKFGGIFGRTKPTNQVPVSPAAPVQTELKPEPFDTLAAPTRPPIPSKPYTPIDPGSVVIPIRPEGSFLAFMRPGAKATPPKKKSVPKKTIALPFLKKTTKKTGKEKKKERYRYIRPDWI